MFVLCLAEGKHLHGSVNLSAVKHEVEEVQVSQG